jgi:hypothetical protein
MLAMVVDPFSCQASSKLLLPGSRTIRPGMRTEPATYE